MYMVAHVVILAIEVYVYNIYLYIFPRDIESTFDCVYMGMYR